MTQVILPKTNQSGANEWSDVEDNCVALREVVNGELDDGNIAAGADIAGSKLANDVLKLLVTGTQRKVAFGEGSCGWEAGNRLSNTTTVEHGLGVEPVVVFATSLTAENGPHVATWNISSKNSTKFSINGYWAEAGPGNNAFMWIAIG